MASVQQKAFGEVLENCLAIDRMAVGAYETLGKLSGLSLIHTFCSEMRREEQDHVAGWERLLELHHQSALPPLLSDPAEVLHYVSRVRDNGKAIVAGLKNVPSVSAALDACYRLEVGMLHPAFESLFEYLAVIEPERRIDYDCHLARFMQTLRNHQEPDKGELFAETIELLWLQTKSLAHQNHFDALTGILNRKGILRAMQTTAFLSKRVDSPIGIIMVDIDHFKAVNDKHGHDTGDIVLYEVAAILHKTVRRSDLVGRLGGEEFVVVACPVDHEGLSLLAEKLRSAVESARPGGLSVTASFGAALSSEIADPEAEMNRLLKVADEQLYKAKNSGRNCVAGP